MRHKRTSRNIIDADYEVIEPEPDEKAETDEKKDS